MMIVVNTFLLCSPGTDSCSDCDAGKFSENPTSTACADCSPNSESNAGATQCKCSVGATGRLTCMRIVSFTYRYVSSSNFTHDDLNAGPDGGDCTGCVPGKFKSVVGSAGCDDCSQGKYSAIVGATSSGICTGLLFSATYNTTPHLVLIFRCQVHKLMSHISDCTLI